MKKSVMLKWVKALRSGKYTQGQHRLRSSDNTFCCLGVLCDISKQGEWQGSDSTIAKLYKTDKNVGIAALPEEVMKWAGIKYYDGRHTGISGNTHSLAGYNDGQELTKDGIYTYVTFLEIADWLERNYKAL